MSYIVDNAPIAETPPTKAERRDLAEEREFAEYEAMFEAVEAEMWLKWTADGETPGAEPKGMAIHIETEVRLKAKREE